MSGDDNLLDSTENEFRNIKLKLKGLPCKNELLAVKALMAMSAQQTNICHNLCIKKPFQDKCQSPDDNSHQSEVSSANHVKQLNSPELTTVVSPDEPLTDEMFEELARKEGIVNVIGDPICKLCNALFASPVGIARHTCPAFKHQVFKCDICGEDKWRTKANLHSHIKWCKKKASESSSLSSSSSSS